MKYFITKKKTKTKKAYIALDTESSQQLHFLQYANWYCTKSESHHCVYTDGPNQNSIFWALIMSIVL